jgi:serine/threonine protein kinase
MPWGLFFVIDTELCEMDLHRDIYEERPRMLDSGNNHDFDETDVLNDQTSWIIMKQLADGLDFIHTHGTVHRDMALSNSMPFASLQHGETD